MQEKQCLCGCGGIAPVSRGKQKSYIHGHNRSTLGMKFGPQSEERKAFISKKLTGSKKPDGFAKEEKNPCWLGDNVGYTALHVWVRKNLGKPKKCSVCKKPNKSSKDGRNAIQYANIDGKYRRVLSDYIPMCPSCHKNYDLKLKKYAK